MCTTNNSTRINHQTRSHGTEARHAIIVLYTLRSSSRVYTHTPITPPGNRDQCIAYCNAVLEQDPEHTDALYLRGSARQTTDVHAALNDFDTILRLQPGHHRAALARGACKNICGDFMGAIGMCAPRCWFAVVLMLPGFVACVSTPPQLITKWHSPPRVPYHTIASQAAPPSKLRGNRQHHRCHHNTTIPPHLQPTPHHTAPVPPATLLPAPLMHNGHCSTTAGPLDGPILWWGPSCMPPLQQHHHMMMARAYAMLGKKHTCKTCIVAQANAGMRAIGMLHAGCTPRSLHNNPIILVHCATVGLYTARYTCMGIWGGYDNCSTVYTSSRTPSLLPSQHKHHSWTSTKQQ